MKGDFKMSNGGSRLSDHASGAALAGAANAPFRSSRCKLLLIVMVIAAVLFRADAAWSQADPISGTAWYRSQCAPDGLVEISESWVFGAGATFSYERSVAEQEFYTESGTYVVTRESGNWEFGVEINITESCAGDDVIETPEAEQEPCCDPDCLCDVCGPAKTYFGLLQPYGDFLKMVFDEEQIPSDLSGALLAADSPMSCAPLDITPLYSIWYNDDCNHVTFTRDSTWILRSDGTYYLNSSDLFSSDTEIGTYTVRDEYRPPYLEKHIESICHSSSFYEETCSGFGTIELVPFFFDRVFLSVGDVPTRWLPPYISCLFNSSEAVPDPAILGNWERRTCGTLGESLEQWKFNEDMTFERFIMPPGSGDEGPFYYANGEYRVDTEGNPNRIDLLFLEDCYSEFTQEGDGEEWVKAGGAKATRCLDPYSEGGPYALVDGALNLLLEDSCGGDGSGTLRLERTMESCPVRNPQAEGATLALAWWSGYESDDSLIRLGWAQGDGWGCIFQQLDLDGNGELRLPEILRSAAGASPYHSADTDGDYEIGLSELLRVVQFYTSGGYRCWTAEGGTLQPFTEDGYVPGPLSGSGIDTRCAAHTGDYDARDGKFTLSEVVRLIQLHNADAYRPANPPTEDGFELVQS